MPQCQAEMDPFRLHLTAQKIINIKKKKIAKSHVEYLIQDLPASY